MVLRVHGGVITDQMLSGGLRFFRLSSAALGYFEHTTSDGSVRIPGTGIGATNQHLLIAGQTEADFGGTPPEGTFAGGTGYLGGILTNPTSYDFAQAPTNTITVNTAGNDFADDGVVVGQKLTVASANTPGNNGDYTVTNVATNVVTVAEDIATTDATDTAAVISVFDILTLSGGSVVTVDTAGTAGTGAPITAFTITTAGAVGFASGTVRTVTSETAGNSDFTLTPDTGNEIAATGIFFVPSGAPVPNSVADRIFRELTHSSQPNAGANTGACTIVIVNQIDDNNIHFACDDSGFSWDTPGAGDAAAEMQAAIRALGTIGGGAADSNDPPVPDASTTGVPTRDLNVGGVTLTETTPFQLT